MASTIALFSLAVVAVLCFIGTTHASYNDNLLQRIGMACICLSSIALMDHVWRHRAVTASCALMSVGMLLFAVGVAIKVVKFGSPQKQG